MISRRGRPVSRLNLSPSSHFLLFEIEAGSQPPAFKSANTALRQAFSSSASESAATSGGTSLFLFAATAGASLPPARGFGSNGSPASLPDSRALFHHVRTLAPQSIPSRRAISAGRRPRS